MLEVIIACAVVILICTAVIFYELGRGNAKKMLERYWIMGFNYAIDEILRRISEEVDEE